MARKFNTRYTVIGQHGTRTAKEVDIVVECNGASTLYREEKEMRRVSNIISNMTGYPVSNIEVREIREI
jgi:hypothetical protein